MANLTVNEQQQNETFFNQFLALNYPNATFPETIKALFLKNCREEGIWLLGLSPIVQKIFVQALTLAIQDAQHINEYKLNKIFQLLCAEIEKENAYLKWQFQQSSAAPSQEQLTISEYLTRNKAVPADYWLQTEDMFNVLAPLNQYDAIYVHTQPVNRIDAPVEACVETALTVNKAKIAYVPIENSGHWTLEIYTQQNGKLTREHYNPPGDGKCGDHTAKTIYTHAQSFLDQKARKDLSKNFGDYINGPSNNSAVIRQQTIRLVEKGQLFETKQAAKTNDIVNIMQTAQTMVANGKASDSNTSSKVIPTQTLARNKNNYSALDKLFNQWNALANHILDEIQHYPPEECAKLWNKFFNDATNSIKNKTWVPVLFHHHQCAIEAATAEQADLAEAMRRSLIIN